MLLEKEVGLTVQPGHQQAEIHSAAPIWSAPEWYLHMAGKMTVHGEAENGGGQNES